ncbi:hypothetical protein [Roseibium sp. LAB1]
MTKYDRGSVWYCESIARGCLGFFVKVLSMIGKNTGADSACDVSGQRLNFRFEGHGPPEEFVAFYQKMIQSERS